jgi:hypothetical protein
MYLITILIHPKIRVPVSIVAESAKERFARVMITMIYQTLGLVAKAV